MFNFSIFTKALTDNTLSKNEFRVLCLMLNTSSFKQSNTFEMYNGFIQDTLGISERNVRDITKSLELKDYIKKEVNTNSHNRNANTYTILGAESCAEKCAENCPPNNLDIKHNNKNITKDFSTYGNSTCREKDITKWTKVFDKNNNLKENEMSDNGTSVMNAKRNEVERNEDKFKEVIISKAMGNINLDKSSMYKAKSQMEYDVALEDLKVQLKKIQDNTSTEAYNNFRAQLGKWFNASKPYMKFAQSKNKKVNAAPARPTDEEMLKLEWFVEGVKVSKSLKEAEFNFDNIDKMLLRFYEKYPKDNIDELYNRTTDRLSEYKRTNTIVEEYIKNVSGEPQTIEVDKLSTNDEKTRQNASKYPQIEEESNMDMCCETKVA